MIKMSLHSKNFAKRKHFSRDEPLIIARTGMIVILATRNISETLYCVLNVAKLYISVRDNTLRTYHKHLLFHKTLIIKVRVVTGHSLRCFDAFFSNAQNDDLFMAHLPERLYVDSTYRL